MNDKAFENKMNRDIGRAKKDLETLTNDGVAGLNRKFEHLEEGVKTTVTGAAKSINKGVGQGLSQYNTKVQDVADKVLGDLSKKAAGYPWVAITLSLAFGLLLGVLLKPGRQPVG
jgi:ElaB/YqjD/DUF883 family membrane-anchored ribosome-binding protein